MSQKDDIKKYYDISDKIIKKGITISFIVNIIGAVLSLGIGEKFLSILVIVQLVASFINIFLSWLDDTILFPKAEKLRRKVIIDDAFLLDTIEDKTEGYYNNNLNSSSEKLILNVFESIYFTLNITKKMIFKEIVKGIVSLIVLIIAFNVLSGTELVLVIFQVLFSGNYILGSVNLIAYYKKLEDLYNDFYRSVITENSYSRETLICLHALCVEYEVVKATYKIRLSSKIFNKLNPELSVKWEDLQKKSVFYKKNQTDN